MFSPIGTARRHGLGLLADLADGFTRLRPLPSSDTTRLCPRTGTPKARYLRKHRQLILLWFEAKKQYSSGIVEGVNANVKLGYKRAYGLRTCEAAQVALYHQLGQLPSRPMAHRFC